MNDETSRIVILEDDYNFAFLIKSALDGLAKEIVITESWDDALRNAQNGQVIWIDLRMPESPIEVSMERVRSLRKENDQIVIIVGSGFISPKIRADLERAGVDGCFYKGVDFKAQQVGALVIAAMMKATKRSYESHKKMLELALQWLKNRYPNADLTEAPH